LQQGAHISVLEQKTISSSAEDVNNPSHQPRSRNPQEYLGQHFYQTLKAKLRGRQRGDAAESLGQDLAWTPGFISGVCFCTGLPALAQLSSSSCS